MKLHLGCGKRFIPGFVHIDLGTFPHIDHQHDIRSLPFLEDNSAELIYNCHAFEYFDREEAALVLQEWRRVLKPGGVLRMAVPDFEALVQVYLQYEQIEKILGPLFGRIEVATPETKGLFFHRTAYDFRSLQALLAGCGFEAIKRYDWRETIHRDFDDFSQAYVPHMDKQNGRLISLNIEAQK